MAVPREDAHLRLPSELDRILHDLRGPLNAAVMHFEVLKRIVGNDPAARRSVDTA